MTVRLFGYDVEITMGFALTVLLFGYLSGMRDPVEFLSIGLVLFFSVLVHELGHALAFKKFGVSSAIRLHFMGGVTMPTVVLPLSRPALVFISLAGPFAGFGLAALTYAVLRFFPIRHVGFQEMLGTMVSANLYWSIFNLVPVIPLDGGHVLEHALGPKRYRLTLIISGSIAALLAVYFFGRSMFATYIFAMSAFQAFSKLRDVGALLRQSGVAAERARSTPAPNELPKPIALALRNGRLSLDDEDPDAVLRHVGDIADGKPCDGVRPSSRAVVEGLTLVAWAELARGNPDAAAQALARIQRVTTPDPALVGSVATAQGDMDRARQVLEAALAAGDKRKEVFGPLIQALLGQGELTRAAALTLDCSDGISTDDLRTIAGLTLEAGVHGWAGRLFEAVFVRERGGEDAFDAARSFAMAGDDTRAIELLKRALGAGFRDLGRIREDAALAKLELPRELVSSVAGS